MAVSFAVERLVLAGDLQLAQAVSFVECEMEHARDELVMLRMRWLREYLLKTEGEGQ